MTPAGAVYQALVVVMAQDGTRWRFEFITRAQARASWILKTQASL